MYNLNLKEIYRMMKEKGEHLIVSPLKTPIRFQIKTTVRVTHL